MRPIIVPIDFSDCSINALLHALSIAKHSELDIVMVWVKKPEENQVAFIESAGDPITAVETEFKKLIAKYQPDLPASKLEYKIRTGKINKEIIQEAYDSAAFLIVVGTHGISGFEEFWIGSNAQKLVSEAPCPIITIRGGINIGKELKRIVMPIDATIETRQKVPFTSLIAKLFQAEVHILLLYTSKVQAERRQVDEYAEQAAKYLHENKIKFVIETVEVKDLVDEVLAYAKQIDAGLIATMSEMLKTTKNLWLGSYAHQMVNHSPIPVLTIHIKDLMRVSTGG
ncbi:MAG: universal stress protein [Bacteroidota bacterium]